MEMPRNNAKSCRHGNVINTARPGLYQIPFCKHYSKKIANGRDFGSGVSRHQGLCLGMMRVECKFILGFWHTSGFAADLVVAKATLYVGLKQSAREAIARKRRRNKKKNKVRNHNNSKCSLQVRSWASCINLIHSTVQDMRSLSRHQPQRPPIPS